MSVMAGGDQELTGSQAEILALCQRPEAHRRLSIHRVNEQV